MEKKRIQRFVQRARIRLALVRGVEGLVQGLWGASILALLLVVADRWGLVLAPDPMVVAIAAGSLALTVGSLRAFFPRRSLISIAAEIDDKAGWKERLSSLLALPNVAEPMELALEQDVVKIVETKRPSSFFPFRWGRGAATLPIVMALLGAAVLWLPPLDLLGKKGELEAKKKKEEEIKKTVEKLQKAKTDLDKPKTKPMAKAAEAAKKLDELVKQLQEEAPDKKKIMAEINKLAEEIKKDRDSLDPYKAMAEKLQQMAEKAEKDKGDIGEMGRNIEQGKFHEAAQNLAQVRQKLTADGLSPQEREKLAEQLEKLRDEFKRDDQKLAELEKMLKNDSLTPEQKEKLMEQIKDLREQMAGDKDLKEFEQALDKALQALKEGKEQDLGDLQEALEQLEGELEEMELLEGILGELEELEGDLAEGEEGDCPS